MIDSLQGATHNDPEGGLDGEELVSLGSLLSLAKRSIWIVAGTILAAVIIAVVYVLHAPPGYVGHAQILIGTPKQQIFIGDPQFAEQTVDSAEVASQIEVVKSDAIAGAVIDKLGLLKDPEFGNSAASSFERRQIAIARFEGHLSAERVGQSYIIEISFVSQDPQQAARITNAIANAYLSGQIKAKADVARQASQWMQKRIVDLGAQLNTAALAVQQFKSRNGIVETASDQDLFIDKLTQLEARANAYRKLYEGLLEKLAESLQQETFPVSDARIVTPAGTPLDKSYPRPKLVLALALVMGGMAGIGIAFVRHLLDRSIRDTLPARRALKLNCLGTLPFRDAPRDEQGAVSSGLIVDAPGSPFVDALRGVKASIDSACRGEPGCGIGIVSLRSGEGKSVLCAGLAALFARTGARTLLIDADFRARALSKMLAPDARAGLIEALDGRGGDAIVFDQKTNIHLLPIVASEAIAEAVDALGAPAMQALIARLRTAFEVVLVDVPALPAAVGARAVGPFLDGCVIVAEYGRTPLDQLTEMVELLENSRIGLFGFVINRVSDDIPPIFGFDPAKWPARWRNHPGGRRYSPGTLS